jgi:hypothetical protein
MQLEAKQALKEKKEAALKSEEAETPNMLT